MGNIFLNLLKLHCIECSLIALRQQGKKKLMFLQDNDLNQNSAKAKESLKTIGAEVVKIPPRSLDLNPIENFFHDVKRKLTQDALDKKNYLRRFRCLSTWNTRIK